MNKDVIYPTMVIRSQAETIELQEKEIERLNNIINELEKYMRYERINDGQIDEWTIMEIQMKLKELKEGK